VSRCTRCGHDNRAEARYTGDGIMAPFGAPLAHEDHAQRACYAALHLQAALRGIAPADAEALERDFALRRAVVTDPIRGNAP
jgi:class 3 adenylate cyclase